MKTEVDMMRGKEMEGERRVGEWMRDQKTYSCVLYIVPPKKVPEHNEDSLN